MMNAKKTLLKLHDLLVTYNELAHRLERETGVRACPVRETVQLLAGFDDMFADEPMLPYLDRYTAKMTIYRGVEVLQLYEKEAV